MEKSPTTLRLYFLGLFSGSSMILYKNVKKRPILVENAWNKGCLQPCKKGAIDKETPLDIFNMQMLSKKNLYKNVSDFTLFSQNLGLFSGL